MMQSAVRADVDVRGCTDSELVELVRNGHGSAFRAIIQRHNQRLYRIARSVVRDESEAEDVLQEAYLRGFAALRGFRGDSSLATWLTRIVLNEAMGRVRCRRRTEELDVLDRQEDAGGASVIAFPGMCASPDPESAAARSQIREFLQHAIDELPDAFRLVLVMRDLEEMSIQETAAILGIRAETVKTRLHRARRLLRKNLDDKLSAVLRDAFPFLGARCERITDSVMARLDLHLPAGCVPA